VSKNDLSGATRISTSNLIRWSGLANVAGGVLLVVSDFLELPLLGYSLGEAATTDTYALVNMMVLIGTVLLLMGLVGLYVGQSQAAGLLGLVGFLMSFMGNALVAGAVWQATFVVPVLAQAVPEFLSAEATGRLAIGYSLSYALAGIGVILFGMATFRARVYPRAAAVVLMIGVVPVAAWNFLPLPMPDTILGTVVAWLGLLLFWGRGERARQPARG
jgi:hypothetical protein